MRRYSSYMVFVLGLMLLFGVQLAFSQTAEEFKTRQKEIDSLKEGQAGLTKEIQDLKKLVEPKPAAAPAPQIKDAIINIKGAPIKGDKNAKLVFIEFSDYQCPACVRHVRGMGPQIDKGFVETGKLRHVFMDLPSSFHNNAFKAAVAGLCAGDQGKFWQMNEKLFNNTSNDPAYLEPENLIKYAEEQKLDMTAFKACLDSGKHDAEIKQRIEEATKAGVAGTPTFILGFIQPDGTVKEVKRQMGVADLYSQYEYLINEALASKH
jgi:protein-disulfide isomerase